MGVAIRRFELIMLFIRVKVMARVKGAVIVIVRSSNATAER